MTSKKGKKMFECIKETITELGWCCACLLAVVIIENFEV